MIVHNPRDDQSTARVPNRRRGATVLTFEFLLICSVLAAVILVAMMTHEVAENASEDAVSRLRPILKLAATCNGEKIITECGLAQIRQIDLNSLQSNFLHNGVGRCQWYVSRDGRTLMIGGREQSIIVTVDDQVVVEEAFSPIGNLVCGLSHDGKIAVVIEQGTLAHCWDLASRQRVDLKLESVAAKVIVDSQHRRIVVKTPMGIDFYNIDAGAKAFAFATTSDGNLLISDDGHWLSSYSAQFITVYDVERCKPVWTSAFEDGKLFSVVDISADSRKIVIARRCRELSVKEIETGNTLFECDAGANFCSITFAADARSVFIGQSDGSVIRQPLSPGVPPDRVRFTGGNQQATNITEIVQ